MNRVNFNDFDLDTLNKILSELSKSRPIFHNEQDFQFELAIKLRDFIDDADIRLEYCNDFKENRRQYIDILIINKEYSDCIAIELKYKTKANNTKDNYYECGKEKFYLKNQSARDHGCYYIYNDISRMEKIMNKKINGDITVIKSFVIFLTNDKNYKNKMSGIFKNYSLEENKNHEAIITEGEHRYFDPKTGEELIDWNRKYPASTSGKEPIKFTTNQKGIWSDYGDKDFYQLVFEISEK